MEALRLSPASSVECRAAASTLLTLVKNAGRLGGAGAEPKFRRINLGNARIQRMLAEFPSGALRRVLEELGWRRGREGSEGGSGGGGGGGALWLERPDPGLLWLGRELIEQRLPAAEDT